MLDIQQFYSHCHSLFSGTAKDRGRKKLILACTCTQSVGKMDLETSIWGKCCSNYAKKKFSENVKKDYVKLLEKVKAGFTEAVILELRSRRVDEWGGKSWT